jgi:hypothetical protein
MNNTDQEEYGIVIEDIPDNELEAKEKLKHIPELSGQDISITPWEPSSGVVTVDAAVIALLVKTQGGEGVVRIIGKRNRYMKAETKSKLAILQPGEKFLLLGALSTRHIRSNSLRV